MSALVPYKRQAHFRLQSLLLCASVADEGTTVEEGVQAVDETDGSTVPGHETGAADVATSSCLAEMVLDVCC